MIMVAWNINGFNSPLKQKKIRCFIKKNKFSIMGLIKTRVKKNNARRIREVIFGDQEVSCNYKDCSGGRIWVGWNKEMVQLKVLEKSIQGIHCEATNFKGEFLFSVIYLCFNCPFKRKSLWNELVYLADDLEDKPWIVMRDFNAIRNQNEKKYGTNRLDSSDDFSRCCTEIGLKDLRYVGRHQTWSNYSQGDEYISCKLDWALMNDGQKINLPFYSPPSLINPFLITNLVWLIMA